MSDRVGQSQGSGKRIHRVNVNFSEAAWRTLTELAERSGRTVSQVIRDAIALEKWFQDTIASGGTILVEQRDGGFREVIPR